MITLAILEPLCPLKTLLSYMKFLDQPIFRLQNLCNFWSGNSEISLIEQLKSGVIYILISYFYTLVLESLVLWRLLPMAGGCRLVSFQMRAKCYSLVRTELARKKERKPVCFPPILNCPEIIFFTLSCQFPIFFSSSKDTTRQTDKLLFFTKHFISNEILYQSLKIRRHIWTSSKGPIRGFC